MIAVGLLTRPAKILLMITMIVASTKKIFEVGINSSELTLIFLVLSIVILLKGPVKNSLDHFFLVKGIKLN